jgi:uncharacterized protein (DUF305 family)
MKQRIGSSIIALAVIFALTACGSEPEIVHIGGAPTTGTVQRPWGTVQTFPEVRKAEPPSDADVQFTRDMVIHHEQAVVLSNIVLKHENADGRIRAAARFIAMDQEREIKAMNAWLKAWKKAKPRDDHNASAHAGMPGMVTPEQIEAFAGMKLKAAQAEFLRLMIFHHEGAIAMAQDVIAEGNNAFTLSVARHMIREQSQEIKYMKLLIDDF